MMYLGWVSNKIDLKVQHQKCAEGGKKAKDSFRILEN